ncbi:MAG: flagellar hook-basal body complex protein, partial [Fuerstia sp.]|nr:flagellar hook-basal body complex protein [Fuerstiella sp.]
MANSLLTGISGLRGHQKMLEVVGNNLANLNTTSFKASRVLFSDLMYEVQRGASSSSSGLLGSVNAVQIGTGSRLSQVDRDFQQGNLEASGKPTDLAIDGSGFFVTKSGNNSYFTRAGSFSLDENGFLSDPATGNLVQRFGTLGDPDGVNPTFQTPGNTGIYIPLGASIAGKATQQVSLSGNLSSLSKGPVSQRVSTVTPFLSAGNPITLTTKLIDLDNNSPKYINGDIIQISGQKPDGSDPDVTEYTITDASTATVGDLIDALNSAFPGATVTLDADGNITATDNATGPSKLNIVLRDNAANTGRTDYELHKLIREEIGKEGDKVERTVELYDASGAAHSVGLQFTKQVDGSWNMKASMAEADGQVLDGEVNGLTFLDNGTFAQVAGTGVGDANIEFRFTGQQAPQSMDLSFGVPGTISGLAQLGTPSALEVSQDGFTPGKLSDVHIDTDGTVFGLASNGLQIALGQMAVATFRNVNGLSAVGGNYFQASLASGNPEVGTPLSGGRGALRSGQLEG